MRGTISQDGSSKRSVAEELLAVGGDGELARGRDIKVLELDSSVVSSLASVEASSLETFGLGTFVKFQDSN